MISSSFRNPFSKHLTSFLFRPPLFSRFSTLHPLKFQTITEHKTLLKILTGYGISTSSWNNFSSSPATDKWNIDASTSPYLSVRIRCPKDIADMLSEALLCFGASSASIDEPEDCDSTDEIVINSIFTEHETVDASISHAADSIGLKEVPTYEIITDEQCDWITKSQESFHPVEVSPNLWIVPEWITPPDIEATNIILGPGFAFGTGDHPTTKLCLLLLRNLINGGESFFDYGTGSGILGIAAVKLGAALSVGIDIDPEAITSARKNVSLNNLPPGKMEVYLVTDKIIDVRRDEDIEHQETNYKRIIPEREKYDIVIANILLNPLIELVDDIVSYAKPGAVVAVTGILSEQLPQIEELYSYYLEDLSVSRMDNWACLSGRKKRNP